MVLTYVGNLPRAVNTYKVCNKLRCETIVKLFITGENYAIIN